MLFVLTPRMQGRCKNCGLTKECKNMLVAAIQGTSPGSATVKNFANKPLVPGSQEEREAALKAQEYMRGLVKST